MIEELLIEEFSCPSRKSAETRSLESEEEVFETKPTSHWYLNELLRLMEKTPVKTRCLPYLKDIQKALEEGATKRVLQLTDDLEELMDLFVLGDLVLCQR